MKETANSIQRTSSTHLPSIKSWFIPVLLRTLCIMWQCTTVQWSGLHFVTLGGWGDGVRGGVTGQLFSEVTLERRVLIPASTRTAYLFFSRVIKDSGMRFVVFFFFLNHLDLSTVTDVPSQQCATAVSFSSFGWMWSSHSWLDGGMVFLEELVSDGVKIKNNKKKNNYRTV